LRALEGRLLPPRVYWSMWQRLLDDEAYAFVVELSARGATHGGDPADVSTWHDDWPAWAALCRDERERALLERIRIVAETHPDAPEGGELYLHLIDWRL
jgi:hypothetical protein